MRVRIKVCCIESLAEAQMAVSAGADALGLVSAMPSGPGVIAEELIAEIIRRVPPPLATFLLTSKTRANHVIRQQNKCGNNVLQLVDHVESDQHILLKEKLPGIKIVQVVHVLDASSVDQAVHYAAHVDALLLDSGNPNLHIKELGGTGRTHNWEVSREIVKRVSIPVFLAGGLNPANAVKAIREVQPFGLDICSGVRAGGKLDANKLLEFVEAVKQA